MQASALGREAPRAGPAHLYLALSEDPDSPLEPKASVARTGLLAVAAVALLSVPPLFWVSSADAANLNLPLATLISKDGAPGGSGPDDGPSGDDPDGTTAPGMTTSTDGRQGGTSRAGTSAPGVTTAPGETSEGGQQTTGGCPPGAANAGNPTTVGQDTSTAPGQETSNGGHGTATTAGETASVSDVEETGTVVGEACPAPPPPPLQPPEITPPEEQPPAQQPPAQQPPGVTPPGAAPPTPPGAAPPPAQQQPQQGVLPARAVNPIATLRGASGCPTQVFFARVTGRAISRVTFTVDGRRVATLTRPDARGVWKMRVNPDRYSVGRHRIVARVTFAGSAARAMSVRQANERVVKVLTITFSRCARKASRPKFTG
jgi:hypothetical protein